LVSDFLDYGIDIPIGDNDFGLAVVNLVLQFRGPVQRVSRADRSPGLEYPVVADYRFQAIGETEDDSPSFF
jgi:hypothetical protein